MCRLKRDRWKAGIAIAGVLILLLLIVWVPVSVAGAHEIVSGLAGPVTITVQATPTEDATVAALNKEKLVQEVQQLKNQNEPDPLGWLRTNASIFLSTLVVVVGGLFGLWRWRVDRRDAQGKESKDRRDAQDKELKDRKVEREKRAEERFQIVVSGLGSKDIEAKVGAAIMLRTFLKPGYEQFYQQSFDLAVAHLRLRGTNSAIPKQPSSPSPSSIIVPSKPLKQGAQDDLNTPLPLDSLSQALITVFKESFPRARNELKRELEKTHTRFNPQLLDAAHIRLDGAYLARVDLRNVWMRDASFIGANLHGTKLHESDLIRANFRQADLDGADLPMASLREAKLGGATLTRVDLIGADLHGADLTGANLYQAELYGSDLTDANLYQADLTDANLYQADLTDANLYQADLKWANLEAALSLKGTDLRGVKGKTKEWLEACKAKGAIIDEDTTVSSSPSPAAPSPPL